MLTHDSHRVVRMHALTARETTNEAEHFAASHTTADALIGIWPAHTYQAPDLAAVLRANTDTPATHVGDPLWQSEGRPVVFTAGLSLADTGLYAASVVHRERLAANVDRVLGDRHPDTLTARNSLALVRQDAGRRPGFWPWSRAGRWQLHCGRASRSGSAAVQQRCLGHAGAALLPSDRRHPRARGHRPCP